MNKIVGHEIHIIEIFSFEAHVLPYLNEYKEDWAAIIENGEDIENEEGIKEFLKVDKWDDKSINDILIEINEVFERESNYRDSASIFDESIIRSGIDNFLENEFGIMI